MDQLQTPAQPVEATNISQTISVQPNGFKTKLIYIIHLILSLMIGSIWGYSSAMVSLIRSVNSAGNNTLSIVDFTLLLPGTISWLIPLMFPWISIIVGIIITYFVTLGIWKLSSRFRWVKFFFFGLGTLIVIWLIIVFIDFDGLKLAVVPGKSQESQKLEKSNSIVYLDYEYILKTSSTTGKEIHQLLPAKDLIDTKYIWSARRNPKYEKLHIEAAVEYDPQNPDNPDYKMGISRASYIIDFNSGDIKKIDLTKVNKYGKEFRITFFGWSNDGSKLVYQSNPDTADESIRRNIIGEYDPETEQSHELLSTRQFEIPVFYDSQKKVLATTNRIINLTTHEETSYTAPTVTDNDLNIFSPTSNFVTIEKGSYNLDVIKIFSFYEPNEPIATIDSGGVISDQRITWSSDFQKFAFQVTGINVLLGKSNLKVFDIQGMEVVSRQIDLKDMSGGALFSPDDKEILLSSSISDQASQWKIIDLKSGELVSQSESLEELGNKLKLWLNYPAPTLQMAN